jgi:hypothetical protein
MERIEDLKIGDILTAPPVQTVIRLEQGRTDAAAITKSFIATDEVAGHIDVLAQQFRKPHGTGCFIQGDFGSGKSHFLAVLSALLNSPQSVSYAGEGNDCLRSIISGPKFLTVDVSLVNFRGATPLERIVFSAMETALRRKGAAVSLSPVSEFVENLRGLCSDPDFAAAFIAECGVEKGLLGVWLDEHPREAYAAGQKVLTSRGLAVADQLVADRGELFEKAMSVVQKAGFEGIVLLMDELSEFLRSKPDPAGLNDDARMLQFLGERAQNNPLWILAAVQESVERTGDIAQSTIRKIKDRYPVRLHLSTVHIRGLIEKRLTIKKDRAEERLPIIYKRLSGRFAGFTRDYAMFRAVYPVHPDTLSLLEGLSDLFSQHRGIVDFVHSRVAGDPSRAIEGILAKSCLELLAPDAIYEHFAPRYTSFRQAYTRDFFRCTGQDSGDAACANAGAFCYSSNGQASVRQKTCRTFLFCRGRYGPGRERAIYCRSTSGASCLEERIFKQANGKGWRCA